MALLVRCCRATWCWSRRCRWCGTTSAACRVGSSARGRSQPSPPCSRSVCMPSPGLRRSRLTAHVRLHRGAGTRAAGWVCLAQGRRVWRRVRSNACPALQDAAMSPAELEMHCCDADTVCSMMPGVACQTQLRACLAGSRAGVHTSSGCCCKCRAPRSNSAPAADCMCAAGGGSCGGIAVADGDMIKRVMSSNLFASCGGSALPGFSALTLCTY